MPSRLLEIQKELFHYQKNMVEHLLRENRSQQDTILILQDFFEPLKSLLRKAIWFRQLSREQRDILFQESDKIDHLFAIFDGIPPDEQLPKALELMEEISQLADQYHEIMKPRWTEEQPIRYSSNYLARTFFSNTLNKDEQFIREVLISITKMASLAIECGVLSEDIPHSAREQLAKTLEELNTITPDIIKSIHEGDHNQLRVMLLNQIRNINSF